jgi:hypothetical protein
VEQLALTWFFIPAGLIAVGVVLIIISAFMPKGIGGLDAEGFWNWLIAVLKRSVRIILDPNAGRREKVAAVGLLLLLVGVAVGLIMLPMLIAGSKPPPTPTPTPTPTAT